jgi:uncharacterized protein YjbI with pentapeptide repeats
VLGGLRRLGVRSETHCADAGGSPAIAETRCIISLTLLLHRRNLAETKDFYRGALRFQVADTAESTLTFALEGGALIFTEADLWNRGCGSSCTACFTVADVDAYFAAVRDSVTVAWPIQDMSYGTREFGITDCNGYWLAFRAAGTEDLRGLRRRLVVDNADLSGSQFSNVKLEEVDFENANMRAAMFHDARLARAAFSNVDFSNVSINDSNTNGLTVDGMLLSVLIRTYQNRAR